MNNLGYNLINKEYFNKHYKEIFELDVFPFQAVNLLTEDNAEEAHRIISKKLTEKDKDYYEYRRKPIQLLLKK